MLEPTKADSFRAGGGGGGGGGADGGAPVAQAMEDARIVPQQPSANSGIGGPTGDGAPVATAATGGPAATGATGARPGDGDYQPPVGQWKDHCFNCFAQMSPSCVISCFLPCFALAMLAKRVGYADYNKVFWLLMVLAILGFVFGLIIFYSLAILTITIHLMLIVRAKYDIPALVGKKKDGCIAITADVLAACFCTPCVISQMLRHTFNYKMQCDECNLSESRVASIV